MSPQAGGRPWRRRTGIGYNLGGWADLGAVGSYTFLRPMREAMYFWLPSLLRGKKRHMSVTCLPLLVDTLL
jgi:hypothetical protein